MSIGVGLLVISLGAIFTFAITDSPPGLDLHIVGVILMTVGAIGLYLRMVGYGPDNQIVTLPRWWRPRAGGVGEEPVYDPMAEDPVVYRPAEERSLEQPRVEPSTHPVTRPQTPVTRPQTPVTRP